MLVLIPYSLAMCLLYPMYFAWRRLRRGRPAPPLRQALAWDLPPAPPGERIWFHAVSVGEVLVAAPLIEQVAERHPGVSICLSASTETGQAIARRTYGDRVTHLACPLDLPGPMRRVVRHLKPNRLILLETELWPNMIWQAKRRGVEISVVNGRISDSALSRYRWAGRSLARLMDHLTRVLVQTAADGQRFIDLGVPPERVSVTGNMKFDALRQLTPNPELCGVVRAALGAPAPLEVLLCGSTMEGEEAILADCFIRLRASRPDLRLVIAPRHPERFGQVQDILAARGLRVARRTTLPVREPVDALVLDTIGELASLYAAADLVFIGGTLVPCGGHNILEPAAAGRPVVVGPSMHNFRDIAAQFLERRAIRQVPDAAGLEAALATLLTDPALRADLTERALTVLADNRGATRRTYEALFGPPAGA